MLTDLGVKKKSDFFAFEQLLKSQFFLEKGINVIGILLPFDGHSSN